MYGFPDRRVRVYKELSINLLNNKTMNKWFLAKVRYEKATEKGMNKKVTELYLVDALSFTEAEMRITEEMKPFINGEFQVCALSMANYSEWFPSERVEDDKWYRVKVSWISVDEKSNKEKRSSWYALVESDSTANAEKYFHNRMKGTLGDYIVESVSETTIMDVYPYSTEEVNDENR